MIEVIWNMERTLDIKSISGHSSFPNNSLNKNAKWSSYLWMCEKPGLSFRTSFTLKDFQNLFESLLVWLKFQSLGRTKLCFYLHINCHTYWHLLIQVLVNDDKAIRSLSPSKHWDSRVDPYLKRGQAVHLHCFHRSVISDAPEEVTMASLLIRIISADQGADNHRLLCSLIYLLSYAR